MKTQVIGVIGGIGSGKSALCNYFAEQGYPVIDTDQVAKEIVKPKQPGLAALINQLGSDYLLSNGELNRRKLRDIFFDDPEIKQRVEAILHPLVRQTVRDKINHLRGKHALIFVAIPVIHQLNQPEYQLNQVLLVEADESQQLERVQKRDQLNLEQVKAIMQQQASPTERRALADDVIENKAGLKDLQHQADAWLKKTLGNTD